MGQDQMSVPPKVAKLYLCHFVCCISRSKIMYDNLSRLVALWYIFVKNQIS